MDDSDDRSSKTPAARPLFFLWGIDSQFASAAAILSAMRIPFKKKPTKLRSWRVSILRQRAHYLGTVETPDERTAEATAVAQFQLDEEQRKRLAVREQE